VGVSGAAVVKKGRVENISEIDSVNIRIPHCVLGVAESLYAYFRDSGFKKSILLYSPPGVGKTTVLKDLVRLAGTGSDPLRIALIDERCELFDPDTHKNSIVDRYSLFPKSLAIENAVRTMSPELIICDEIGTEEEADAILSVQNCGVPFIASAHGDSLDRLRKRPAVHKLLSSSVFDAVALLIREGERVSFKIEEV